MVLAWLAFVAAPVALFAELVWGPWAAFGALALVLLLFMFYYAWKLAQLSRWLDNPVPNQVPDGSGLWGDVLSKLYKRFRHEQRSQQSLIDALARFQQAAEAIPDGAIMLDADNRIEWCNTTAERHFGITLAHDRGQPVTNLLRQPNFVEHLRAGDYHAAINIRGHESTDQVLSALLVQFGNDQRLLLARDITHLEKLDAMRRDFIANVSHELRTPLTVLIGFVETLGRIGEDQSELFAKSLAHMQSQAQRMERLVDDLLTLSRLEDARNPLIEHPIDIADLIVSLLVDAEQLSGPRHRFTSTVGDFWLVGNRDEIRSALSNLVSNAVRYTAPGGSIHLVWEKIGPELAFRVKDTGEGIAPEHIPRLTERFYRVDRSRSRATGGTGLGLAIVKHVLIRHQARLEIDSAPGHGSTFSVIFPATRLTPAAPKPAKVEAA
jgi:two-component system, OmpR family, phosphate regulon sensor histidine kinase PhoR